MCTYTVKIKEHLIFRIKRTAKILGSPRMITKLTEP